jgi:hypothetical protein
MDDRVKKADVPLVRLHDEAFDRLRETQREAVRDAVLDIVRDEEAMSHFWSHALTALRGTAQKQAGGFLIDQIMGILRTATKFAVIGLAIYWVGGWTGLSTFIKSAFADHWSK